MALTDGLLAYYAFEGNYADSWGGHDASPNDMDMDTDFLGGSAIFNGSGAYLEVPHGSWLNVSSITISFWMNPTAWTTDYTAVVSKQQAAAPYSVFDLRKSPGATTLECWFVVGGTGYTCYTPDNITTGQYQHIVFTYDAGPGTGRLWRNIAAGTANTSPTGALATNTTPLWFGAHPGSGSRFYNGWMDEIGIWDRVLTNDEITTLYNGGAGMNPTVGGGSAAKFATFYRPKL